MMAKIVYFWTLISLNTAFCEAETVGPMAEIGKMAGGRHSTATETLGIDAVKCKVTMGRRGRCRWVFDMDI